MKVLVSGANSLFAREFSASLERRGHTVKIIGRQSQPTFSLDNPENALSVLFDEYEVFVHFAHSFERQGIPDVNESAAQKIVNLSKTTSIRKCIYISSDSASSRSESNYGRSKFRTERVFLGSIKGLVLRVGVISDLSIPSPFAQLHSFVRKSGVLIFPSINERNFTLVSVEEITENILAACVKDIRGGPFSVSTDPRSISILEVLNESGVYPKIKISLLPVMLRLPIRILKKAGICSRRIDSLISVLTSREQVEGITTCSSSY